MTALRVDRAGVLAFRARASHLHERLPAGSLARAAFAGLQDSAPRAAVISLHARVEGVEPSSWEDPSLVQIWGPRGADYVVPRSDVAVFTLGRLPRDPDRRRALEQIADEVHRVLDGRTLRAREVHDALPDAHVPLVRWAAVTGRLHIRWDASTIWIIPTDPPNTDPKDARLELARRFLRWYGPVDVERFAWWAGIETDDAARAWDGLSSEMTDVDLDDRARFLLREDEEALAGAAPVSGVRLLPHSDPYIKIDEDLVVPDPQRRLEVFPRPGKKTAFWPVAGAVLVDGEIAGAWARQQRRVTVHPWGPLTPQAREAIEQEALGFPIPARSGRAEVRLVET